MTDDKLGRILHLQRLSTEDGPGIRTTVFFKGCPLRCEWCHNPESLSPYPQVQWLENRCIGCDTCLQACPNGCLTVTEDGGERFVSIDRARCQGCGTCSEACPANAMELLGTVVTVEELVQEVIKDRTFFETSGGGVTVSGGEPAMQPGFVATFLAQLRDTGIPTALDTCGLASRQALAQIVPHADLVMFDLKEIDAERHRSFTGQSNEIILDAVQFVGETIANQAPKAQFWIRTPLIPGATATQENLSGLGAFIAENLNGLVERWELCAFNNLCRDKYRRLGLAWRFEETPLLTQSELDGFEQWAKGSGVDPGIVIATGATRNG